MQLMGKYIFIRHGESNINVLGILSGDSDVSGLTEKGMAQARRTAEQLSGIKIDGIISSPLKRAFETAKIIGEVLNIDVKTDERLIEVNLGRAKEKKINEFTNPLYPNSHITGSIRNLIGMEDWDDMISRVKSAMDSFNGKYIFVSHSDPIRAIASYYLGWTEDDSFGIDIKNASMTVIDSDKNKVLCLGAINLDPEIKKLFY